jgi:DNA mismatch repair protein MutL
MKGQYPITFLFIEISPSLVDVNIHPTKREVRFRDEFAVRQCVIDAVRQAIEPKGRGKPLPVSAVGRGEAPDDLAISSPSAGGTGSPGRSSLPAATGLASAGAASGLDQESGSAGRLLSSDVSVEGETWRILGVIGRLYVLAESPEGLVLIDQHAAHERVLFEKMLRELAGAPAPSQKLLLPVTLELDARDAVFLQSNLKTLHKLGIGISEFGDRTFLLDSLPPYFQLENLPQTVRNIVDELRQTGEEVHARRLGEDKIATAVCRHAVKARDPLKDEELRALLRQLHQCELPYTCPHGRPTMIQISYAELEKKFRRKV